MDNDLDCLFRAIQTICEKTVEKINGGSDKTKRGRIVEKKLKMYTVQIQDKNYIIKSNFDFAVNESVLVLFPQGRSTDLYIYPNE